MADDLEIANLRCKVFDGTIVQDGCAPTAHTDHMMMAGWRYHRRGVFGTVDARFVKVLMALATGTFLFVSTTDMIPAVREQRAGAIAAAFVGVTIFYFSLLLIKHVGLS